MSSVHLNGVSVSKCEYMISNDNNMANLKQIAASNSYANDEVDLREILKAIWHGKLFIITISTVFIIASVFYALSLPNVYKSEALLAPVTEASGLKVPGQLGGLAALAGVNLGSSGADKSTLALEIIKSREFIGRFIEKYDLFVPVMAAKGWNQSDDSLIMDPGMFNSTTKQWVREVKPPYEPKPSLLETHEKFLDLLLVSQDEKSGIVKLSIHYYSPFLAQQWVSLLVKAINDEMRQRELAEAKSSIAYLTKQLEATNVADIRTMLFSLIEEQTKTVMLANVREEYVFKTIDPAIVAEKKAKPARAIIVILFAMLGAVLSTLVVLVRYFSNKI